MTVKTTADPKGRPTLRRHRVTVAVEAMQPLSLRTKPPSPTDPAALGHAKPSKAAEMRCCGGAGNK